MVQGGPCGAQEYVRPRSPSFLAFPLMMHSWSRQNYTCVRYHLNPCLLGEADEVHINRSIVIDYLLKTFENEDHVGIAFIYCTYEDKDKVRQTPSNLIACLWMQLINRTPLSTEAMALYQNYAKIGSRPSLQEVLKVFHSEIARYSLIFIIVDALDELSEDMNTRESFLAELRSLPAKIRVMITSRDIPDISKGFSYMTRRDISASEGDMRKYLTSYITHLHGCVKENTGLQETIISNIIQAAAGM